MPHAQKTAFRHEDRDELARHLTGVRYPVMAEDLMALAQGLLVPSRVLGQLNRLPLHRRFYSVDDVCDCVAARSASQLRGA
jgi:hypothetical protein